jgi:hypothetical protein
MHVSGLIVKVAVASKKQPVSLGFLTPLAGCQGRASVGGSSSPVLSLIRTVYQMSVKPGTYFSRY